VFNGALSQRARDVSNRADAWIVAVAPTQLLQGAMAGAGGNIPQGMPQANLFQTVQDVTLGIRFGAANVTLTGEASTQSPKDAQALADVLRFLSSMVQANRNGANGEKAAALVDAAKFTSDGPVIRLTVDIPEKQAEELFVPTANRPRLKARAAR
jgi:hypothetical protein